LRCNQRWVAIVNRFLIRRTRTCDASLNRRPHAQDLPQSAVADLRRIKARQAQQLLRIGVAQDETTFIVADEMGKQLSPDRLRRAFGRFCRTHGFSLTFHSLRHTASVMMLSAGIDVRTVAGRLGHQDGGRLLLSTYGHFVDSADRAAEDKLGALLG
jgi:integrase